MRMRKTKLFTRATREYKHTAPAPATKLSRIHLARDKPNLTRVTNRDESITLFFSPIMLSSNSQETYQLC